MAAGFERGLKVLVAEDEPLAVLVIEDVLVGEGHAVVLAADGAVALDLAAKDSFDVLLTDLAMPRVGGVELILRLRLRQSQPHLPVVVMTGFLSPVAAQALCGQALPPVALLHKPFEIDRLPAALALVQGLRDEAPGRAVAAVSVLPLRATRCPRWGAGAAGRATRAAPPGSLPPPVAPPRSLHPGRSAWAAPPGPLQRRGVAAAA